METSKQAVTGFKVLTFQVKKSKDTEKVKMVLEAEVDTIGAGEYDMGDVLKALLSHQTGDVDVGLSVFVESK
jgi:uncharacterized protein YqeY